MFQVQFRDFSGARLTYMFEVITDFKFATVNTSKTSPVKLDVELCRECPPIGSSAPTRAFSDVRWTRLAPGCYQGVLNFASLAVALSVSSSRLWPCYAVA